MKWVYICVIAGLLMLAGCGKEGQTVTLKPFIGGESGITVGFSPDFREEVRDGGEDPFDVLVWLENEGEHLVKKEDVRVWLEGIKPQEFGKSDEELRLSPEDDLDARYQDDEGNVIQGVRTPVEFNDLNHLGGIVGSRLSYPLRANICYAYRTDAVSKICVRRNLLNPIKAGICDIEGSKQVHNSGAPVHVSDFREFKSGRDKVRFSFDVVHVGSGEPWKMAGFCEGDTERDKNKVIVKVDTNIPGLSCTGLDQAENHAVSGEVRLHDSKATITCRQELASRGNYEQRVEITLNYKYYDSESTTLTVLSSGEEFEE